MNDFTHLHVHSEYSLLDGYATTKGIVERAAELGMDSIALTDHGVMYGAMEFYTAAKKANVKPIVGVEAYMAPGSNKDPMTKGGKNYYHLLLLAKNETGYKNLLKMTSRAHLDGLANRSVFARPRIDRELLEKYHEGVIVTSSCIAGEVIQHLTQKQRDKARDVAGWHRDLFGEDYFLELQLHDNTPELDEINDELVRIGKELGIQTVATNDTHFLRAEDLETQKHVMSMGMNMTFKEFCGKGYVMDETYHIMSAEDMWQRFKKYGTKPIENTRLIADRCNLKLDFGRVELPTLHFIPEGYDAASYLRRVCEEGLMKRFNGQITDEYVQRLNYELNVINATGFPDYMLIVWDYVRFARAKGIPAIPRGSAGASLVLYTLFITDVDPIANKLLFERFLSLERLEMPDIDTDFADTRRGEVLDYIATTYGRENVAQIITYGTLGAKAALRDMARVLEIPLSEVDRVAKLIPALPVGTTISKALERVPELKQIYDSQPEMRELIDWARKVEGRMKNVGTHACGVVVSRHPLEEMVPLQRTTKDENAVMAAFEGPTLAKMGLLKMDILGLANLSIVAEALRYIEQTTGTKMELADIPLEDKRTFEGLGRGETTNVFQLESAGMTRYLMQLKPTRVDDLYAMVALYRPGPIEQIPVYVQNKNNPRNIQYIHPILKPILEDTYGVIVYQEQIMQLLQMVAEYTLGEAYIVIKAISKKDRVLMAENEVRFKKGCLGKGLTQAQADLLWELILPFAGYSFNRPHSTLYGLLSYQTAWLKTNYPTEYMAAVLSASAGEIEDVAKSVAESGRLGVAVLPPNVNYSDEGFTITKLSGDLPPGTKHQLGIRFGLSAIRNVGSGPVEAVIAAREKGGPFKSLEEFCDRVDRAALNKRMLESLIKCGAIDDFAPKGTRHQKLAILDQALGAGIEAQKARESGQVSMFDAFGGGGSGDQVAVQTIPLPLIKHEAQHDKEQLAWEKELLGMYVSDHPIVRALADADMTGVTKLGDISNELIGQTLTFCGQLNALRRVTTKKGDAMLVANFEDDVAAIPLVAFPKSYEKYRNLLTDDALLCITAKVDQGKRDDEIQLLLDSAKLLEAAPARAPREDDLPLELLDEPAAAPVTRVVNESTANGYHTNGTSKHGTNGVNGTNGTHTKGAAMSAQSSNPPVELTKIAEMPTSDGPISVIKSRVKVTNNGNGNGNGNGHASAPDSSPAATHQTLRLYFARSDDHEADISLMQHLHEILCQSEGDDVVMLHVPNNGKYVVLKAGFGVRCAPALIGEVTALLGEGSVAVE